MTLAVLAAVPAVEHHRQERELHSAAALVRRLVSVVMPEHTVEPGVVKAVMRVRVAPPLAAVPH